MRDVLEQAIVNIAGGSSVDEQVMDLIEMVQGWWPSGEEGRPLSFEVWSRIVKTLVTDRNKGVSVSSALNKSSREFDIPKDVIEKFLRAADLWRPFAEGTINLADAAKAFEGAQHGKGIWTKGTSKEISGRYKFVKFMRKATGTDGK